MYWATGNPHAAHKFAVLMSFVLSATCTYYLVRYLVGDRRAAVVAAICFGYCPYVFSHLPHVHLLMTAGFPLSMLAFHRVADRPTPWRGAALGLAMAAQAFFCGYYAVFVGPDDRVRRPRRCRNETPVDRRSLLDGHIGRGRRGDGDRAAALSSVPASAARNRVQPATRVGAPVVGRLAHLSRIIGLRALVDAADHPALDRRAVSRLRCRGGGRGRCAGRMAGARPPA